CVDRKGNIWFGSNGGITKYDGKNFKTFTENEGLCQNKVRSILEDREGNLWIGTNGGVSKFSGMTFTMISTEDGLCNNEVHSIIEDSRGNYWFGTAFGISKLSSDNIFNINKNNFTNYYVEDGLSTNIIWTQLEDQNKNIWFGTNRGGISILKNTKSITPKFSSYTKEADGLPNNIIYSLLEDKHKNIWLATNRGISVYDGIEFKNFSKKQGLIGNITSCLHETKDGKILIGTGSGISIYDPDIQTDNNQFRFINIDDRHGLEYPNIYTINEDWNGNIWIGTFGGGVYMLQHDDLLAICNGDIKLDSTKKLDFINFSEKDGLSSNSVNLMEFDNNGFLWLGTIKGINKLDIYKYLKTGEKEFRFYGKDKGFRGIECSINSVCKDSNGNLWFGTIKGAYLYNPDEDRENTVPPLTHINGIRLFYEKENLLQYGDPESEYPNLPNELELPYSQNHLTFDFIGISLTIPEKVTYQYQLIGFDKGWSPITTENYVTYSNLSAGDYTFKVKACNNDGFWNDEANVYSFSITPPFWETWWFLNSILLMILGSIYSFHKLRIRGIERDRKRLEKTVEERTYELTIEKEKTEQVNTELIEQKRQLEETNTIIEEKNRHITDSIIYARHIQEAIFPRAEYVNEYLPNSFGLYKPKEIVSGDFAWFNYKENKVFIAAVDCTGHGVPGAFLSVLGNALLHQIINETKILKPGEILKLLHKHVQTSLHQLESDTDVFDGMDIALCSLESYEQQNGTVAKIEYAGAFRPLYHVRRNKEDTDWEVNVIKANQLPIGGNNEIPNYEFTNHKLKIKKDEAIYIFSDGITDQFGGKNAKKFMGRRLEEVLIKAQEHDISAQREFVENAIDEWKGDLDQTDDILMIGVKF
ncbi:MAG: SpoIIE family protein phosphatase, partial [Bacteroidia bacterium]|nr:SpoIIE family protein phosphatase [Bacteroidia bacterium]